MLTRMRERGRRPTGCAGVSLRYWCITVAYIIIIPVMHNYIYIYI